MRRRLSAIVLALVSITSLFPSLTSAANGTQKAPKLINFYFDWQIPADVPAKLAKWDIVVLDMDQSFMNPERVREIKRLNPNVKILAYIAAGEINQNHGTGDHGAPGYALWSSIPESWYLHNPTGARVSWWPGSNPLNATDLGPTQNGLRWNTFLGPFIRDHIMSTGLWDGVFLDAAYGEVSGFFGTNLDPDDNGAANTAKQTDEAWRAGMRKTIQNIRTAIGSDKLILNNSSAAYSDLVNGMLEENFPRYGWAWPFAELRASLQKNVSPKISSFNTNTNDQDRPADYKLMRYGLTSALVADAYYSFDQGASGHKQTWWYDEYETSIGSPRAAAKVVKGPTQGAYPAVWSRDYDRGVVYVNSTKKNESFDLSGEYEHLTGAQDAATNNGAIVTKVTVPAEDGVILLRRSEATEVRGTQFQNGQFLQVYNAQGTRLRNGFFAGRDDVPGGANVLSVDVDRDGGDEIISSSAGVVTVRFSRGGTTTFRPYGTGYKNAIALAAGQTDGDAAWELVLAPESGRAATVLITDSRGKVKKSWLAYRQEFTGGASVALGDADANGLREIATAPGRGGGPHVRTFKTDGQIWRGGFFAFDANENGGAFIAMGDTDGDGRAELVVGSGPGSRPRIRVYDGSGYLKSMFDLGTAVSPTGVRPTVSDIDGDGKAEILIPGNPF